MTETAHPFHEARALLRQFQHSKARSCHIRTEALEIFFSRDASHRAPARAAPPAKPSTASALAAPHLATVVDLAAVGSQVRAGEAVGQLRVLDRQAPLLAASDGIVAEQHVAPGALVEYGQTLLTLHG
ncbi:acetyl-CoA carboxylase biotin carboxyl carrier protein subunit [Novosphingobium rosa]|uniref:acetyl-CoA carboxylase biotin carboxyl carrier protein subunit n=1 Tax=Novosphingobium rosa TaxID=76978 RepID=UPI00082A27BC|nr:acetyl-CoA carboxylase biotin carboxyl carrier protein subunit [Novosphingobium rosa]